jgi:preprotein translocase subunit SecY
MPYITSSIIMNLLTMMHPPLQQLRKEGEAGRRKMPSTPLWNPADCADSEYRAAATLANQGLAFSVGFVFTSSRSRRS